MSPFQIVYGMHLKGVYEHRIFGAQDRRSEYGEYFSSNIHGIQENVKKKL